MPALASPLWPPPVSPGSLQCVWRVGPSGCPFPFPYGTPFHAVRSLLGLVCPLLVLLFLFSLFVVIFVFFCSRCAPVVFCFLRFSAAGAWGLGDVRFGCRSPTPLFFFSPCRGLCCPPPSFPSFLFPFFGFFGALGAPSPPALFLPVVFRSPAAQLSVCSRSFCVCCLSFGCFLVVTAAPPPWCVFRGFCRVSAPRGVVFLCCVAPASLLVVVATSPPPPPRCARCALCCPMTPCCAALPSGVLRCCVAVFCAACRGVVSYLSLLWAAPRCALLFVLRSGLLLRAVPCVWSCRPASFFALRFAIRFCCALPCAVACCVPVCCAAPRCSALCCPVVWCVVVFRSFGAAACCVVPSGAVRRPGVLRFPAPEFCGVSPRCVLSVVRVLSWCGGACCCSLLCFVLWLSWGVLLCVPCPPPSVRCCAALCWCACVLLFVRCAPFAEPRAAVRCCVLCCCLWCAVARCWVWLSAVVCWWSVSLSVSLTGRVACFPVAGVVCCLALLPCVVFCGAVLSCGAGLSCSAVFSRCWWSCCFFSL